jgi:hypothetical protein
MLKSILMYKAFVVIVGIFCLCVLCSTMQAQYDKAFEICLKKHSEVVCLNTLK